MRNPGRGSIRRIPTYPTNSPVFGTSGLIGAPSNNADNVVGFLIITIVGEDSSSVLDDRLGINGGGNGTAAVNLRHDLVASSFNVIFIVIDQTVFGNSSVGEIINFGTSTAHATKCIASLTRIRCVAGSINVLANSLGGFRRTRNIRLTGVVGDISSRLNELIRRRVVSSVTATRHFRPAVQDKLNREVNIVALTFAGNLDTISKRGERSVSPTTSAILRNVLVQRMRQVADAIHIRPGKRVGQTTGTKVRVRQGGFDVVVDSIFTNLP